jgi:hypothetical protein
MLILLAVLALAPDTPSAAQPAKDDDPIICTRQNVGDEVGTRLQRPKICMRKSDRAYIDQQNKQTIQKYTNDGDGRMRFIPQSGR